MSHRLEIIDALTATISLSMGLATSASMVDTFAATSAFAAVHIVFVGSFNPKSG
ncbi:uncharacterized protein RCO7_14152 [Rhynchosporium graminicola]|uniref:Uncharacterized protein n=2 Tax=Rhynchosporium TaxID=38037 RepID=A0A1E1MNY5_RHYSE|nr:uncharacterized protein RCO7_14152 [Rhynchosporium commune]CZT50792.1 uncharacterized protein RSE6_11844 [Rhynchosporium secalis]